MNIAAIKLIIKIAVITGLVIILFQVSSLLFIYKYFSFDYYLSAVAIFFLIAGIFISKYQNRHKTVIATSGNPLLALTAKEASILHLIIEGKSNKEIAAINFVEVSTIKTHINNIYAKLGLNNRTEAILRYRDELSNNKYANIHPPGLFFLRCSGVLRNLGKADTVILLFDLIKKAMIGVTTVPVTNWPTND
jgi:DNA-binding CsgD family transcriptional regulator